MSDKFMDDCNVKNEETSDATASSSVERCAICLGPVVNCTRLNACPHFFCYACIYEWIKMKEACPICKTPINYVTIGSDETIKYISAMKAEMEAAKIKIASNETPTFYERKAITEHIRNARYELQSANRKERIDHQSYQYTKKIDSFQRARMLREDLGNLSRAQLMAHPFFRRIIYEDNLQWYPIVRPSTPPTFSPSTAAAAPEDVQVRILPWIRRELPRFESEKKGPNKEDVREKAAQYIADLLSLYQINSPQFQTMVLSKLKDNFPWLMDHRRMNKFCDLLYEFCASGHTVEQHDENSSFRLPQTQHTSNDNDHPLVVVDDNSVIQDPEPVVLGDDSSDDDMYMFVHPACRLPRKNNENNTGEVVTIDSDVEELSDDRDDVMPWLPSTSNPGGRKERLGSIQMGSRRLISNMDKLLKEASRNNDVATIERMLDCTMSLKAQLDKMATECVERINIMRDRSNDVIMDD